MTTGDWVTLIALCAAAVAVLAAGVLRRRLAAYAYGATCTLVLLWSLALGLALGGWGGADRWADCTPSCSLLQDMTGTVLTWGALLTLVMALIGIGAIVGR